LHLALVVSLLAAASPSVAVTPFTGQPNTLSMGRIAARTLAVDLARAGFDVVQPPEAKGKGPTALSACGERSDACTPELATRLGVGSFLLGTLSRADDGMRTLEVRLVEPGGALIDQRSVRAPTDWAMIDAIHAMAPDLVHALSARLSAPLETHATRRSWTPWLLGGGAAATLGGIVLLGLAAKDADQIASGPNDNDHPSVTEALRLADSGRQKQTLGIGLVAAGAAALGTGIAFYLTSAPKRPRVVPALVPTDGGATLSLSGGLP
jgi:hypothetical protein